MMKEFYKSVHICQSCHKISSDLIFWLAVYRIEI